MWLRPVLLFAGGCTIFFFFFFLYGLGSKNGDTSLGFYLCAGNGRPVGPEVLLCVEEEEPAAPLRGV